MGKAEVSDGVSKKNNILYRPLKELKRLQNRKLHYFITRRLYPFSPYYRRLFDKNKIRPDDIKTVEDLKKIPFTSKKDILNLLKKDSARGSIDFLLQPSEELIKKYLPKNEIMKFFLSGILKEKDYLKNRLEEEYRPVFLTATAGTTDQPIPFLYTNYDLEKLKLFGKRIIDIFGLKREGKAVNVFPYMPHLAFWQTVFAGFSSNLFILSTGGGKTLGTDGNIRALLKVKPQALIGIPSYVYHILKTAKEQNLRIEHLENIALGGARIPGGFKKKVSKLLSEMGSSGVKIQGTYGFTEARSVWCECPTELEVSSGYHTYPDMGVFEIIDPATGGLKKEGEDGEIVYSNIDARGSCVLRFRTGDLVKGGIVHSPCPYCGRTVPRISGNITRASNIMDIKLSKIKGALVNLNNLECLLDDKEEIDEWQIEIVKKDNDPYEVDELMLHVSLLNDVNKEEFITHLNQDIFSSVEVSFNKINFVSQDEIQHKIEIESALKAKKIVDNRPKA